MVNIEKSIENYLSCHTNMSSAENIIRKHFLDMGLHEKCIDNSIKYLKILRANINDLNKQIETATDRFSKFKCTFKDKGDDCCFLMLGTFDSLGP